MLLCSLSFLLFLFLQELAGLKEGSSDEVEGLKAQLASTKEMLEAEIKQKEEVCFSCGIIHFQRYPKVLCTQVCMLIVLAYSVQALAAAKARIEELEKKLLENVPIDTAKEIGAYQAKMVS